MRLVRIILFAVVAPFAAASADERRVATAGKWELALSVPLQLHGKYAAPVGLSVQLGGHLSDRVRLHAQASSFGLFGLVEAGEEEYALPPQVSRIWLPVESRQALAWSAAAGVELAPLSGKFSFGGAPIVDFDVFLATAVGVAGTHVLLGPRSWADTGSRPVGSLGVGFQVYLGRSVSLRLEIRNLFYNDAVERIEGCNFADLVKVTASPPRPASATCRLEDVRDATAAKDLLKDAHSEVRNQLSLHGGVSLLF